MEIYMNKGIKEVIAQYPKVGDVLNDFGVGCVTCSLGTCLLKDVIGIHNLSKEDEIQLMAAIEKIIYPDRDIRVEERIKSIKKDAKIEYSSPIKQLVDEHARIKILLGSIPKICEKIKIESDFDYELVLSCVDFIRSYADKFHHSKEEDILFKYADENSDVIKSMLEEHKLARWLVRSIVKGVDRQDADIVIENLTGYGDLLAKHIKKEDEILYPFIQRNMNKNQEEELIERFNEVNDGLENGFNEKWIEFLKKVENM